MTTKIYEYRLMPKYQTDIFLITRMIVAIPTSNFLYLDFHIKYQQICVLDYFYWVHEGSVKIVCFFEHYRTNRIFVKSSILIERNTLKLYNIYYILMYGSPKYSLQYYAQHLKPYGYETKKILGSGAFAEVVLAVQDSAEYAVKCIRRKILKEKPELLVYIKNEFQIMEVLDHPNIIKQYGIIEDAEFYFIILEYCNVGNLLVFQAQMPARRFSVKDTRDIMSKLIKGLKLVHDRGFIHRDIKPQNVLLKKEQGKLLFKIGDFGFARPIQNIVKTYCGTTNFMAPEILTDKPYTVSVDCWSLGVLMYFMLFGQLPFKGMDILSDIKRKCKNGFNLMKNIPGELIESNYEDQLSNFFEKLFVLDGAKRIGLKGMMSHPLMAGLFQENANCTKIENVKTKTSSDDSSEQEPYFKQQKKEVDFQLEKIFFLKDTIIEFCERNDANIETEVQISLHYYLLKAYLYYSEQLLNSLTTLNPPESTDVITREGWIGFCKSETGLGIAKEIAENIIKNLPKFNQVYEQIWPIQNLIPIKHIKDSLTQDITQASFQDFKTSYRAVIGYVFKQIHQKNGFLNTQQFQMKLRLFCCHLINRVFEHKNIQTNLNYYFEWRKKRQHQQCTKFQSNAIKKWLSEESKQNLDKTINLLYQRYMSSK